MHKSLDVLISIDTTGSMFPCLAQVRRNVDQFISGLFDTFDNLRIGLIAHGDYCDYATTYITTQHPLSADRQSLCRFVRTVKPTSGGDADECYERVLKEAHTDFNWQSDNKILIMIGDAEPHEQGYNAYGHYVDFSWKSAAKNLVSTGIKIYPVQCLSRRPGNMWTTLAQYSGTPRLELAQFFDITQLLTAIMYKQDSNDRVIEFGEHLQETGQLNRNLANVLNLLLDSKELIGGIDFSEKDVNLETVAPARFQILNVDATSDIKSFVETSGARFKIGRGFYELTKAELVQEKKEVVLRDKKGDMYTGKKARDMIGLPVGVRGKVYPKRDLGYTVFIQSTSANRKLVGGTKFLYEVDGW